jgi:hypothetical protein
MWDPQHLTTLEASYEDSFYSLANGVRQREESSEVMTLFPVFQPPENELQKGGVGDRVMSEHQLRVQRSLQKLNVPDWYKNSSVARGPEGFLLKRSSDGGQGWPGLCSKTTSLSSLGSAQSAAARSPTGQSRSIGRGLR